VREQPGEGHAGHQGNGRTGKGCDKSSRQPAQKDSDFKSAAKRIEKPVPIERLEGEDDRLGGQAEAARQQQLGEVEATKDPAHDNDPIRG
jgi:hypothetical protein